MWTEFVKKSRAVSASGEQLGALTVKWDQISQVMAYRWPATIVQKHFDKQRFRRRHVLPTFLRYC